MIKKSYTLKKQRNIFDNNNPINYQTESTTAARTEKRSKRMFLEIGERNRFYS